MQCPRCQQENPAGQKFCGECGARLDARCSACGTANPPGQKFCGECGERLAGAPAPLKPGPPAPESYIPKHLAEKILASRAALEGERKQVTVLFADVAGSTELIRDLDAEEAQRLLDGALGAMMDGVHRYEGTVCRSMGDGILALFGAPLAHEDHALRACYAALAIQEAMRRYAAESLRRHGVDVQARVGLNSGEVIVRLVSDDLHMDYTALGQTVHLAARMEQVAAPGTIRLTTATLGLVEGYVQVRSLGPVPVKGLAEPPEVFELVGAATVRTRLQAAAARGLTRFVGREAELEQLRRAQQLAGDGHGQVAAIVGEAGVGKSRLVYELTHSHRLDGWLVLEAPSVSYGKATSYLPVLELLKDYFKIRDRDDLREVREKVTGKLLTLDRGLEPTLPALLALLDVPMDPSAVHVPSEGAAIAVEDGLRGSPWPTLDPAERRRRTLDAVKRLLLREAREQPLLLIFEDLHWIDSESQAVLDTLVDSLVSARLLLLVNYRPEYQHAWGGRASYSQLRLDPLPAESIGELLEALLGDDPGLAPLEQLLSERGNPFLLEETVRTLVETGALAGERGRYQLTRPVQAIQVPPTVQAMLAARIDRLPAEDKRLLQVASVVGKDVPLVLLQAIAELPDEALRGGLDRLQAAELLYEAELYPDLEYAFKHSLTHEVAYGGLLRERRRELHARIVEAIETLHRDRLGEQIERLAHHAVQGELRKKAVDYLRQAGNKAAARSALPDALAWFEQALGVLETLPESRSTLEQAFELRLELRGVLFQLGQPRRTLERLREAEALAERLNDDRRRGRVGAFVMNVHAWLGGLDEAHASGARALAIARSLGDLELRILSTTYLAQVHFLRGEYERTVELATDNLAALPADWAQRSFVGVPVPASIVDRVWLFRGLAELGRFAEAAEHEAEAIRLAEPTEQAFTVGLTLSAASTLHLLRGDWARARARIEHAIVALRAGNVAILLPGTVPTAAWLLAQSGEASEALARLREGEQLLEPLVARGLVGHVSGAYHALGRAALLLSRLDEAQRLADRAVEFAPGQPGSMAQTLHLLGDVTTHPDRFDAERGEAHYRQALALAEPRGMRPLAAHCHLGLGKLYRRAGQEERARAELASAAELYRAMEMTFWLEQAEAALAQIAD